MVIRRINQLIKYIFTSLFISIIFFLKKIGKKEELKDGEHYKNLNDDDNPDFSSPHRHIPEPFVIKKEQSVK